MVLLTRTHINLEKEMKRFTIVILILFVCAAAFAAPTLAKLLPNLSESDLNRLISGSTIEADTSIGGSIYNLSPSGTQGSKIAFNADRIAKGFAVGGLSFIPYPERFQGMTEEEKRVELYNIIRSISTQKGITYISHLAGDKPVILFEDSYMISNPADKKSRIDDPVSTEVPTSYSCYAFQKDNRFGKNVYTVDYTIKDCDFLMDISNYTQMKYKGFSCMKPGELHMYLEVIMAEEGFVLFTMAVADGREPEVKVLFITVDLPSAFTRRTTALKEWFEKRINQ